MSIVVIALGSQGTRWECQGLEPQRTKAPTAATMVKQLVDLITKK